LVVCLIWLMFTTVNQRVAGSSPAGGANKPCQRWRGFLLISGWFLALQTSLKGPSRPIKFMLNASTSPVTSWNRVFRICWSYTKKGCLGRIEVAVRRNCCRPLFGAKKPRSEALVPCQNWRLPPRASRSSTTSCLRPFPREWPSLACNSCQTWSNFHPPMWGIGCAIPLVLKRTPPIEHDNPPSVRTKQALKCSNKIKWSGLTRLKGIRKSHLKVSLPQRCKGLSFPKGLGVFSHLSNS